MREIGRIEIAARARSLAWVADPSEAYRYPVALFTLPDGRTGIAHCPERYNRLEIEDAITGERLTASGQREPRDVFHSRLAVSGDGR